MNDVIKITPEGHSRISEELKRLKTIEHPAILREIAESRADGDSSGSEDYEAANERKRFIESLIVELESKLARVEVVARPPNATPESVVFGSYARILDLESHDEHRYRVVGDLEADVKTNAVALSSPMGRALINKQVGDVFFVALPNGEKEYEVISISFD